MSIKTIKFKPEFLKPNRKSVKHPKTKVDMSKLRDTLQQKIQNRKSYITTQSTNPSEIASGGNTTTTKTDPENTPQSTQPPDEFSDSLSYMNQKINL